MSQRAHYPGQRDEYNQQYQEGPEFDPYQTRQPHDTYDQGGYQGYRDEPAFPPTQSQEPLGQGKEGSSSFEPENYTVTPRLSKTSRNMRAWRYDNQGNLWNKGSRPRCIGRFFCCTILIALFLIISIVLSLALWIRPPNVIIGSVQPPSNGSTIQVLSDGLQINLEIDIGVDNPNYFSVNFKQIKADIFYPINNTLIGSGLQKNVVFHSHTNSSFTFPFDITYKQSIDPTGKIIADLGAKCLANPQQDVTVDYKVTLGLRILFITVSPVISNSAKFKCPITADQISGLLGGSGLAGALGGGT